MSSASAQSHTNAANGKQPFFPVTGQALDVLKILAALFMLVDHVDAILLERTSVVMQLIGRGAFPLFCYATAAYLMRGGQAGRYAVSLLAFGVIVQPVYGIALEPSQGNVLFSLAAGCALASVLTRLPAILIHGAFLIGVLDAANPSIMDFGLTGACLPAAIMFSLQGKKQFIPWLAGLLFMLNVGPELDEFKSAEVFTANCILVASVIAITWGSFITARFFTGEGRLLHRYALHIFYPGHLALLALIAAFL